MFAVVRAGADTWQFTTPEAEVVGATVSTVADTAVHPAAGPTFLLLLAGVSALVTWLHAAGDDRLPGQEGR